MGRQIFVCECHSLEHQVVFWYDQEEGSLYCEPHLTTNRNFIERFWYGVKYALGYKSRFGDWDSTIFQKGDLEKLKKHLNSI